MSNIRDFEDDQTNSLSKEIICSIDQVLEAANNLILSDQQLRLLSDTLTSTYPTYFVAANGASANLRAEDPEYGAAFSLADEVNAQIRMVRALRATILDEDGAIIQGSSARDAKEVISSSSTLLTSLMKFHEKIINQDRMRLIEQATIEAIKTLPDEQQEKFFSYLSEKLEMIK